VGLLGTGHANDVAHHPRARGGAVMEPDDQVDYSNPPERMVPLSTFQKCWELKQQYATQAEVAKKTEAAARAAACAMLPVIIAARQWMVYLHENRRAVFHPDFKYLKAMMDSLDGLFGIERAAWMDSGFICSTNITFGAAEKMKDRLEELEAMFAASNTKEAKP
jgi:hypothetical protein